MNKKVLTLTMAVAMAASVGAVAMAEDSKTFGYIAYDMTDIWNEYSANAFEYAAEPGWCRCRCAGFQEQSGGISNSYGVSDSAGG